MIRRTNFEKLYLVESVFSFFFSYFLVFLYKFTLFSFMNSHHWTPRQGRLSKWRGRQSPNYQVVCSALSKALIQIGHINMQGSKTVKIVHHDYPELINHLFVTLHCSLCQAAFSPNFGATPRILSATPDLQVLQRC